MKEGIEEGELEEFEPHDHAEEEVEDHSISSVSARSRGRPPIPATWSKVISLQHDDLDTLKVHDLATDLKMAPFLPCVPSGRRNKTWAPIFLSAPFLRANDDVCLKNYKLGPAKLLKLGKQVSMLRATQREAALEELMARDEAESVAQ